MVDESPPTDEGKRVDHGWEDAPRNEREEAREADVKRETSSQAREE